MMDGSTSMVDISELGRRIRKLRLEHRLTLKQVEQASGLSATHLSEIERGRTSPTIGALTRIARALSRDASYFIESEERAEVGQLSRESRRSVALANGVTAEVLTEGIPGSRVFAYRLIFDAKSDAILELAAQELPGDAFYLVREGELSAEVEDTRLELRPGDSAQVSFDKGHRLRVLGSDSAEVIAVLTRPLGVSPGTTDGGPRPS
jgi:transcriptional regulator with XRE-family HTH domain